MSTLFDPAEETRQPKTPAAKKATVPKATAKPQKPAGTAVAVHQPKPPKASPAPKTAGQMLTFIGTAAMDPRVDPAKMRDLLAIRKELKDEEAREQYTIAMLKVQRKLPKITKAGKIVIEKNGRVIQSTPYARYEDLNKICKPILLEHGFVASHKLGTVPVGENELRTTVTTILKHEGGHQEEAMLALPVEASGSKNNVQGIGSSISYGKRYGLTALLNLVAEGEDDDGNQAEHEAISSEQLTELIEKCDRHGVDKDKFCVFLHLEHLADLAANRFQAAKDKIDELKPLTARKIANAT